MQGVGLRSLRQAFSKDGMTSGKAAEPIGSRASRKVSTATPSSAIHNLTSPAFARKAISLVSGAPTGVNGGFALGFDFDGLVRTAEANGGKLEQVFYGEEALRGVKEELRDLGPGAGFSGSNGWVYANETVWPWLIRVKNPAYHEEREWRVVLDAQRGSHAQRCVQFRAGTRIGLVPYVEFSFEAQSLRRVIVGPGPYPELRSAGVKKLLQAKGYADEKLEISTSSVAEFRRP